MNQIREPILQLENIRKSFGPNTILKGINFELLPGEVHVILGANGAGKSTLMKIIAGALQPDQGSILINGQKVNYTSPGEARRLGISYVAQEPQLIESLSVAENLYLGREPKTSLKLVNKQKIFQMAKENMEKVSFPLEVTDKVKGLNAAEKQMVEIGKSIIDNNKILILDEPTAPLTREEIEKLFQVINLFKKSGVGIIYITHHMDEIKEIGDRVTVLKDGLCVNEYKVSEVEEEDLVKEILGERTSEKNKIPRIQSNIVTFEVKDFSVPTAFSSINFQAKKGEIVSIFGLVGSGREELLLALNGSLKTNSGTVSILNTRLNHSEMSPIKLKELGLASVPGDRKRRGVVGTRNVKENIALSGLDNFKKSMGLDFPKINDNVEKYIENLSIKLSSSNQNIRQLSGGNQQKALIARALFSEANILLIDDPTVGVDVKVRSQIYEIFQNISAGGKTLIIGSSDVNEACYIADRLFVLHRGRIVAELEKDDFDQEKVLSLASGIKVKGGHSNAGTTV